MSDKNVNLLNDDVKHLSLLAAIIFAPDDGPSVKESVNLAMEILTEAEGYFGEQR